MHISKIMVQRETVLTVITIWWPLGASREGVQKTQGCACRRSRLAERSIPPMRAILCCFTYMSATPPALGDVIAVAACLGRTPTGRSSICRSCTMPILAESRQTGKGVGGTPIEVLNPWRDSVRPWARIGRSNAMPLHTHHWLSQPMRPIDHTVVAYDRGIRFNPVPQKPSLVRLPDRRDRVGQVVTDKRPVA